MSAKRKAKPQARHAAQPQAKRRAPGQLADMAAAINGAISEERSDARAATPAGDGRKPKASTRVGKKGLVLYVDPDVTVALRRLAALNNTDQQTLGLRALELLFQEHGMRLPGVGGKAATKT